MSEIQRETQDAQIDLDVAISRIQRAVHIAIFDEARSNSDCRKLEDIMLSVIEVRNELDALCDRFGFKPTD